ncbi:hypothetical protein [Synechocystis sp. PCC 7509]|uniref:hypothetical protein n=1 Tax=Synechocystis sp. PCC 7509 TaxID=927677 RepID=UPI0002ACD10A|nr:hypothetical protein [Synechocystis sp. PCC 7509]
MKRFISALKTVLVVAPVLGLSLLAQEAWAGSLIYDPGADTCTGLNCNASVIFGTYQRDQANNAEPFTVQVFSSGNECVRIHGLAQAVDLEAVLVAPNGQVWRNDDGGGSLRPLIKAITPSVRGWYTLQISGYSGLQARSDFQLAYGRYNSANPNCSGATVPSFGASAENAPKPSGNLGPLPPAGTGKI